IEAIESGKDVPDRSAKCLSIAMALLNRKIDDDTIISILTNKAFFLGQTAFDHAKTDNRDRAAYWVEKYIVGKAKKIMEDEESARLQIFEVEDEETGAAEIPEWAKKLDYTATKPRRLKNSYKNIRLILE